MIFLPLDLFVPDSNVWEGLYVCMSAAVHSIMHRHHAHSHMYTNAWEGMYLCIYICHLCIYVYEWQSSIYISHLYIHEMSSIYSCIYLCICVIYIYIRMEVIYTYKSSIYPWDVIYTYICIYICVYTYIHIYTYMYIYEWQSSIYITHLYIHEMSSICTCIHSIRTLIYIIIY